MGGDSLVMGTYRRFKITATYYDIKEIFVQDGEDSNDIIEPEAEELFDMLPSTLYGLELDEVGIEELS